MTFHPDVSDNECSRTRLYGDDNNNNDNDDGSVRPDADITIPYEQLEPIADAPSDPMANGHDVHPQADNDDTIPYENDSALFTCDVFRSNQRTTSTQPNIFHQIEASVSSTDEAYAAMFLELREEFKTIFVYDPDEYFCDYATGEIFRVDAETAILTEADFQRYSRLIEEADYKELQQFIHYEVFRVEQRRNLPRGSNIVDGIWVRKWKTYGKVVKSRMCSRGCFDKQKHLIDKHSSTATRISQRVVISSGLTGTMSGYDGSHYYDDPDDVDTESLDIQGAFLQGLTFDDLAHRARALGYELKELRDIFVQPPENVWRHFRKMDKAPNSFKIPDNKRSQYVLYCLRPMYGFTDAPLLFQLALLCFLIDSTGAYKSVWDENYLYWIWNDRHVLSLTAHVDDLQITGCKWARRWIYHRLTERFGPLKRQTMPYVHAGIQTERISPRCVLLHQSDFVSKLELAYVEPGRKDDEPLSPEDITVFRSKTCSCLWATQTRATEACCIVSLQQHLTSPTVRDLITVNQVIKRMKKIPSGERRGVYLWKLRPPLRIVSVSDASGTNSTSNYASEGQVVCLAEDRIDTFHTEKGDWQVEREVARQSGRFHNLCSTSGKASRVSYSTSHAETNAAAKTIPLGHMVSLRYTEPEFAIKLRRRPLAIDYLKAEQGRELCTLPHDHFVDCMDLWELACGYRGIPQDKGQRLGVLVIREERRSLRHRRLYHVTTHYMLADLLTKYMGYVSKSLHELETSGHWTIKGPLRVREGFGSAPTPHPLKQRSDD